MVKTLKVFGMLVIASLFSANAAEIAENQKEHLTNKRYKDAPQPPEQLVNTDKEPELTEGFENMFPSGNLDGWVIYGGTSKFTYSDGVLHGVKDPKSPESTYLVSPKLDYADFIFTCDFKWLEEGNTGVQFRSFLEGKTVKGYQCEMDPSDRGWTGGIYGQSFGGWKYAMWLKEHDAVRASLKKADWNRITIMAKGNVLKTWINGVGATHLVNDELSKGFFAFQIHKGKVGVIDWKNIKVKELK